MAQLNFTALPLEMQPADVNADPWAQQHNPAEAAQASVQHLLNAISATNPTRESVMQYLYALLHAMVQQGLQPTPMEQFFTVEAFNKWVIVLNQIKDEEPAPPAFDGLSREAMLYRALEPFHCNAVGVDVVTFADRVQRGMELRQLWLASKDSPTSFKDRRANAKAQRRYRERQKDGPEGDLAKQVTAAYNAYVEACKQRKDSQTQWDEHVRKVFEDAKQARTNAMTQWDAQVRQLHAQWQELRAKQND